MNHYIPILLPIGGFNSIYPFVFCRVFFTVTGILLLMPAYIGNKFNFKDCGYPDLWLWGWIVIIPTSVISGIPVLIGLII